MLPEGKPKLLTAEQRIRRAKARERLRYKWYFYPTRVKGYYYAKNMNAYYAAITRDYVNVRKRCASKKEARAQFLEWISRLRSGEDIRIIKQEVQRGIKLRHSRNGNEPSDATPKIVGVCYQWATRTWYANISINGKFKQKAFSRYEDALAQRLAWEAERGTTGDGRGGQRATAGRNNKGRKTHK